MDKKWVFIHIPKTAGKAFCRAVAPLFDVEYEQPWLMYDFFVKKRDVDRSPFLAGHTFYPATKALLPPNTGYITLLRDPIDRSCSHWEHILREPLHYFHNQALSMTFSGFIRNHGMSPLVSNFQARYLTTQSAPPRSIGPIEYQMHEELKAIQTRELSERARGALMAFDLVGFQECLPASTERACIIMGIGMPEVHQRKTPYYRHEISSEDISYLEQINDVDMELYNEFRLKFENG